MTEPADPRLSTAIRDAIQRRWGHPAREARYSNESISIEVMKYLASATGEGVNVYLTVTDRPFNDVHLSEFVTGLDESQDDIAIHLTALARLGASEAIHYGTTVQMSDCL